MVAEDSKPGQATAVLCSAGLDSAVLLAVESSAGAERVRPIYISVGFAWEIEEFAMLKRLVTAPPFAAIDENSQFSCREDEVRCVWQRSDMHLPTGNSCPYQRFAQPTFRRTIIARSNSPHYSRTGFGCNCVHSSLSLRLAPNSDQSLLVEEPLPHMGEAGAEYGT